jgi:predicted Zn-dependent protease
MARFCAGVALAASVAGCAVSTQQEVELGTSYAQQINSQLPIVRDAEVNRYINLLGETISQRADSRGLDWHFFIVDSREVNAFAVPGGFVYVNRGLIERTSRMSQLAGVLAHEIGHVTQRHSVQQMQRAQGANIGVALACVLTRVCESGAAGALINVGGSLAFAKFSRDDEREADRVAVQYVMRAGIDPRGIPEMFQILIEERQRRPGGVDAWFSTHPLEQDRLRDTEAMIAQIPAAQLRNLTTDTQAFRSFRSRLMSLRPVTAR